MASYAFPSKLPREYVTKTLAALFPSREEILAMTGEQVKRLAGLREELVSDIESNPVKFFKPNAGGQDAFCRCRDVEETRVRSNFYFAGNKGGKTTAGAIITAERTLGQALWGLTGGSRAALRWPTPARVAVFADDYLAHTEVSIPNIQTWFPRGAIRRFNKNSAGFVTSITLSNGSVIHFHTYDQGSDKAEGKDWDMVWCDEPPPRSVYTAIIRGLVASNGFLVITGTLLKETWLYDEQEHGHVRIYEGSIHDNRWLNDAARADFLASLTDDERETREAGKPANLVGVIYKQFQAAPPYIIPHEPPRHDWPIVMGVDPHERRPNYVLYGYVTPSDRLVIFDYALPRGSVSQIEEWLRQVEQRFPSRPVVTLMDPNRGRSPHMRLQMTDISSWQDAYESMGYNVVLGEDNIHYGHAAVHRALQVQYNDDNTLLVPPGLVFTDNCLGKGGPVFQMQRYSWEDWAHRRIERDVKEKPKDLHKDFPDIIRYMLMAELRFDALRHGHEVLDRAPGGWRERELRAY